MATTTSPKRPPPVRTLDPVEAIEVPLLCIEVMPSYTLSRSTVLIISDSVFKSVALDSFGTQR